MIPTMYNMDIPKWLHPHMQSICKCGSYIMDEGPIEFGGVMKLTQRWCSNPACPYHMGKRIEALAKYFKVEQVGEETALTLAQTYKMKNHLEALRFWFVEKPEVHLYQIAEVAYIYGIQGKCKDWLAGYTSFESYFNEVYCPPEELYFNRNYLVECEKYFTVKQSALARGVLKIMMTGSVDGFGNRKQFLEAINEEYAGIFRVEDNKKTVRNTICLVKESWSIDHEKTGIALANGIPILGSKEFLVLLQQIKGELENEDAGVSSEALC